LAQPAPLRSLKLDAGEAVLDDLRLPGELAPGQGLVVLAQWQGDLPKKLALDGHLGGDELHIELTGNSASLARVALPLWLARATPEAFVSLADRGPEYDEDTWNEALRAYQRMVQDSPAVTPYTSLVALAPGDAYAKDRLAFVKKWGPSRFSRLAPPPERTAGMAPEPPPAAPKDESTGYTPRAFMPTGDLDEAIVKRLMQTYVVPQAKACYVRAMRGDAKMSGDIDLVVEMARGEVTTVYIAASTFKTADVDLCVIEAAYGIQVPRVGLGSERDAIIVVRYPMHFKQATVTDEQVAPSGPKDPGKGGTPISPDDEKARRPETD
jgi:hypothetical protein